MSRIPNILVVALISFVAFTAAPAFVLAQVQPPEVEWERTYGGTGWDEAYSVQQTTDGGYIVAGATYSFGDGDADAYLLKTDTNGNVVPGWPKTFGGAGYDEAYSVQQTDDDDDGQRDDGYIVAGYTRSFRADGSEVYLVKTDALGTMLWQKTFGGDSSNRGYSVQQTSDGGYIVGGYTAIFLVDGSEAYLVKTDANGNLVWQKTFGGAGSNEAYSVQQTDDDGDGQRDDGYIVAGIIYSSGEDDPDAYLLKTDANGNVAPGWPKTFGGVSSNRAISVQQTADGGYIVAGGTYSLGAGSDVSLFKTDANGNVAPGWPKTFGGARNDSAFSIQQTQDGGYIVAGGTYSFSADSDDEDVYLLKTDAAGILLWQNAYGGANHYDAASSVQQTTDGGYVVAGYTGSFGNSDVYLIKLYPEHPPQRIQLNIFQSGPDLWFPLTEQVRKDLFKPALPVVVIVHGWNIDLLDSLPFWTHQFAAVIATRLPNVNILAWDWQQEAKGKATQPNDPLNGLIPAAARVWDQSKKLGKALQQTFQAADAHPTIHLMGHSLGSFLAAFTAINLQHPLFGNGVYPVANVTLWDPPDPLFVPNSLGNNVPYLRLVYGTTVDCFSGTFNDLTYFSNVWYVVPEGGHDTFNWYQNHALLASEPTLHARQRCDDPQLPTTFGFGASLTHAPPDRQLDLSSCLAAELDVSLISHPPSLPFGISSCTARDELVYAQYCIADLASTPVITAKVTGGLANLLCDCAVPDDLILRMQLRRPAGAGGGAGVDPEPLVATYTLPQTITAEFDAVSFTYRIEAAPSPVTFTVSVDDGVAVVPLFLATSESDLGEGDRDSTHLNITPYHGKEVSLIFSLASDQPDAIVEVSNLTMWQAPFHDNVAPVANAGVDQAVAVTDPLATVVSLDASGTNDPNGDPLVYVWVLPDPVNGGEGIVAVGEQPTVELPLGGYLFTLHARDPFDGFSSDDVIVEVEYPFVRGDANADGQVDIADPIVTLWWLFVDSSTPICMDAADLDDGGAVDISDPVDALNYLFQDSAAPKPPFPGVGLDPTPDLLGCTLKQH